VLSGDWLVKPGLVIAAGANHWYTREVDGALVKRARLIIADNKEQAQAGCGALLWAIGHGLTTWDRVKELGDVLSQSVRLPPFQESTILFASHGLGITDLAIAARAYELAKASGLGTMIKL
jgi:alanine dehydrogenase